MKIIFDLQEYLIDKPMGELIDDKMICPYGDSLPTLFVEQIEDTRVVRVVNRTINNTGVELVISSIKGIGCGDRLTIVGRFGQSPALHGTRIVLFSGSERSIELDSCEPYNVLYSLSCVLADLNSKSLGLSFTKTNMPFSGADFYVDGILIVRKEG